MCYTLPDSTIDLVCFPFLVKKSAFLTDSTYKMIPYSSFPNNENYYEGKDIYVLGYPGSVGANYWTRGLLRKGIVSWLPKNNVGQNKFLIDCNIFPGNSGGPVFTIPPPIMIDTIFTNVYNFLGIVVQRRFSYNSIIDSKKRIPITASDGTNIISPESMGIGVVEPAENVLALLRKFEIEWNRK